MISFLYPSPVRRLRLRCALLLTGLLMALGLPLHGQDARAESLLANSDPFGLQVEAAVEEVGEPEAGGAADLTEFLYPGPQGIRPGPRPGGRPLRLYRNDMVDGLIRFFTERKRDVLERGWRRSGRYVDMIRQVLREEGVPEQLAYLAAVESNFNPQARSPARAVGLWQFTAPTARKFGLRIHRPWYDERLDAESSTHAAARLLGYLYDRYESWELALAAYNAGEARVNRALADAKRRGVPQDYWHLRLPRQTRGFVPAFLALTTIMEDPDAYGLEPDLRDPPLISEGLEIRVAATLTDLAERLQIEPQAMLQLNLAWRGGLVPPFDVGSVLLRVPPGRGGELLASLDADPPKSIPWLVHHVREGETASQIAQLYSVRTRDVLELNQLRWRSVLAIGQPLLVPVAADTPIAAVSDTSEFDEVDGSVPEVTRLHLHRVQDGESLWTIARQYGVRMTQLRIWNRLANQVLQPNQELIVYLPAGWTLR